MATANFGIEILSLCGNNIKEAPEQCDGADLGGASCVSQGFGSGSLSCSITCAFDTSLCVASLPDDDGSNNSHIISSSLRPPILIPIWPPVLTSPPAGGLMPNPSPIVISNINPILIPIPAYTPILIPNGEQFDFAVEPIQFAKVNSICFVVLILLILLIILVAEWIRMNIQDNPHSVR